MGGAGVEGRTLSAVTAAPPSRYVCMEPLLWVNGSMGFPEESKPGLAVAGRGYLAVRLIQGSSKRGTPPLTLSPLRAPFAPACFAARAPDPHLPAGRGRGAGRLLPPPRLFGH